MKGTEKKNDDPQCVSKNETIRLLGLQKYPIELDDHLDLINAEAKEYGWPIVVIKAYCYGVINGKRIERRKKTHPL